MFSFRKKFLLAGLILVLLGFVALLFLTAPSEGEVKAQVGSIRQYSNGVVVVTVFLTNGMHRAMHVVDDVDGKPHFALQCMGSPGSRSVIWLNNGRYFINPGTNTLSLGDSANQNSIRLISGQCLTNIVVLTNPPPRFRLMVSVRDMEKEHFDLPYYILYRVSFGRLGTHGVEGKMQVPTTSWIEIRNTNKP